MTSTAATSTSSSSTDTNAGSFHTSDTHTTSTPAPSHCPFQHRFGRRLPRSFADEAAGMHWRTILDTFAPSTDHFHLADFTRRPLGRGITAYEAIIATPDTDARAVDSPDGFTAHHLTTQSCGEITAMSEMLGQLGASVEIECFHQYEGQPFDETESWCTILRATCGRRQTWALGFGANSSEASIAALLSAATLLHLRCPRPMMNVL